MSALQVRYRPKSIKGIYGNTAVKESLIAALSKEDKPTSFLFTGKSGCLRGDTLIFDPIDKSNISVKERYEKSTPFHVFSFCPVLGTMVIAEAMPPVKYHQVPMFRVETDESIFFVTNEHRFLLENGEYLSLKELNEIGFSSFHLKSISEFSQSIQHQDESHYLQIGLNSQEYYLFYNDFYDELLQIFPKISQEFVPSLIDVLEHNHYNLKKDDLVSKLTHIHSYLLSYPLSMKDFFHLYALCLQEYLSVSKNVELFDNQLQNFWKDFLYQSHLNTFGISIHLVNGLKSLIQKFLNPHFLDKFLLALVPPYSEKLTKKTSFTITSIKQITEVDQDNYYDFHVPILNNYFVGGIFHHNCGKTTFGRVIANELGIDPINIHIYNAASTRGIDTVREIIQESKKSPLMGGSRRIYILEECHGITGAAAEALLDFLEHPAKDVFIILTTTEPDALKVTIKRRCFQGEVKPLLHAEMSKLIAFVLKREKATISDQATNKIIEVSDGSAGQALKLLDMIIGVDDTKAMDLIESIFVNETQVIELCRLLVNINMKSTDKWKKCSEILKTITGEPESNRRVIMGYFNTVLLSKPHNEDTACLAAIADNFKENYYNSGKLGLTLSVFSSC